MKTNPGAQDLLAKSRPLVGSITTFRAAYPQVSKLSVQIAATPMGFGQATDYTYSLENAPGQYCPCPNRQCVNGGFDVGTFLYGLISKGEATGEATGACRGHERMNRRDTRSCHILFRAKAELAYADSAPMKA